MMLISLSVFLLALSICSAVDMTKYSKRTGAKYLTETAAKDGVITLKSGMLIEVLKESTLKEPKSPEAGDSCDVTYAGTFKDGKPFDGGRTSFAPNQVIKGWTEAMQYMVEGDKVLHYTTLHYTHSVNDSQAVKVGDQVFVSGCLAMDPVTKTLVGDDAASQTRLVLTNMKAVLEAGMMYPINPHITQTLTLS